MITLRFATRSEEIDQVEERLKEMVLGYEIKKSKKYQTVELVEGDERIIGIVAIQKYLDDIQGELKNWWYCEC